MPYYPERRPDPYAEEQKRIQEARKAAARARRRRLTAAAVTVLLVTYGVVRLSAYGADYYSSRQTSQELYEIYEEPVKAVTAASTAAMRAAAATAAPQAEAPALTPEPTPAVYFQPVSYPDNPDLKVSERFRKLRKKSKYIVGWLSMDGVEEAVAQKDNSYFLTHDATGKKNVNGAIFADSGMTLMTRPYTVYLFGHNMKSGNMFGRLRKYKEGAYFFRHRIITFDSMYEEGKFAVFAVAEISTKPGDGNYYDLWSLESNRVNDRKAAIEELISRSFHANMLDVWPDEQLVVLVTCCGREEERLVVAARRLRDGETENRLTLPPL